MKISMALCCCLFIGLGPSFSGIAAAREPQTVEVKVVAGDNLYKICNIYLENFRDWTKIAEINGLKDPDKIHPGQKLKIPVSLLQGTTLPGLVAFIAGEVMYQGRSLRQWAPIQKNHLIYPGDSIRTGQKSSAEIHFGNNRSVLLRQNTELALKTSRKLSRFQQILKFFLSTGKAILKIRDITGKGSRYEIQTPSAIAAARGTHFRTAVDASENMRCEVLSGSVAVEALKKSVRVYSMQGTLVAKGHTPLSPVKLLPAPTVRHFKDLYRSLPLVLEFTTIDHADKYRVELAKHDDFKAIAYDQTSVMGTKLLFRNLEDGTYYLRSRSIDKLGIEGPSSVPVRFTLRANPLAPYVRVPKANARVYGHTVSFRWMRVPDAKSYHMQVAEDSAFHNLVADLENIQSLTHRLDGLPFRTFYFRIRSIAADGFRGEWSSSLGFDMVPLPVSPQPGDAKVSNKRIELQWRNLGPGFRYHIQVAKDEAFGALVLDEKIATPTLSFKKPEDSGTYYIRISSIDSRNVEGKFSKPQSFQVKNPYVQWVPVVFTIILIAIVL